MFLVRPSEPGPAIMRLPGSGEIRWQRQRLGRRRGAARSGARDAHGADKTQTYKGTMPERDMRKVAPFAGLGKRIRRGNRARPGAGVGRIASRRGLLWSRWLSGQRAAWPTRLGPGRARKPAGRGRAGPGEAQRPPSPLCPSRHSTLDHKGPRVLKSRLNEVALRVEVAPHVPEQGS